MFYIKCWGRYNYKKEKDKSVGYSYYNLQYNNKQKHEAVEGVHSFI